MRYDKLLHTGGGGAGGRGGGGGDWPRLRGHAPALPPDSPELSDALRHVQRRQHLLEDGSLHVGAAQVRLLQVAAGKVTVLQGRTRQTRLWFCWFSTDVVMR